MAAGYTAARSGRFYTITPNSVGMADWDWTALGAPESGPQGICVRSINFSASGADTLIIRDGSTTGPEIYRLATAAATDDAPNREGFGKGVWMRPYILASEQTFTTPANCHITFELA